jgi:sugar phosphate isomerase/epimerase
MQTGLCSISNKERSLPEIVDLAAEVGFDGIEVWENHLGDDGISPAKARGLASEAGLSVPTLGSYLRPGTDEFEEDLPDVLDAAETLEADLVRVWAGEQEYGDHDEDHWDAVVNDMRQCADAAADRGLALTVEKHAWTLAYTADACLDLLDEVDAENVGINWDPKVDADEDVDEALDRLAPVVNHVHVSGRAPEGDESPIEADLPQFDRSIDRLAEAGFDGYVDLEFTPDEMDDEEAVRRDGSFLSVVVE